MSSNPAPSGEKPGPSPGDGLQEHEWCTACVGSIDTTLSCVQCARSHNILGLHESQVDDLPVCGRHAAMVYAEDTDQEAVGTLCDYCKATEPPEETKSSPVRQLWPSRPFLAKSYSSTQPPPPSPPTEDEDDESAIAGAAAAVASSSAGPSRKRPADSPDSDPKRQATSPAETDTATLMRLIESLASDLHRAIREQAPVDPDAIRRFENIQDFADRILPDPEFDGDDGPRSTRKTMSTTKRFWDITDPDTLHYMLDDVSSILRRLRRAIGCVPVVRTRIERSFESAFALAASGSPALMRAALRGLQEEVEKLLDRMDVASSYCSQMDQAAHDGSD